MIFGKVTGKKFIMLLSMLLLAAGIPATALAEEASVTYGSEGYEATAEEVFNIGVYIQADSPDFLYEVTMQYDPEKLEYRGGADGGGNGLIQFSGQSASEQKKYMLIFKALTEGETTVSITGANVVIPAAAEEGAEGDLMADEPEAEAQEAAVPVTAQITAMASAPVRVKPEELTEEACRLDALTIAEIPDFTWDPNTYDYEIEAEYGAERLTITAEAAKPEAEVEIGDTSLAVGDNLILVTVRNGARTLSYHLNVNRPEPPAVLPEAAGETEQAATGQAETEAVRNTEEAPAESKVSETAGTVTTEESDSAHSFGIREAVLILFLSGCALIVIVSVAVLVHFLKLHRKPEEETEAEEEREEEDFDADEEDDNWLDLDDDDSWKRWAEEAEEEMAEQRVRLQLAQAEAERLRKKEEEAAALPVEEPQAKEPKAEEPQAKESPAAAPAPAEEAAAAAVSAPAEAEAAEEVQEAPVIRINDVSMHFKISEANATSLKEYVLATIKRQNKYHELIALDHINFEIGKGEVVGIVGTNGSGKSTLLKLIAGALGPTGGHVEVDRKKVQLLTLGTGFDTELTARENVYLNGAIIGYSKEFIDEHYDEIVEFAELDGFMDEKIKNFSSGMVSRLGFSIATVGQTAEILILDEVLSVGDMFFRKKSEKRIKEMIHSGSTVLIVSHSTDTILKNCTKAVWIEKGVLREIGEPKIVCEAYRKQAG